MRTINDFVAANNTNNERATREAARLGPQRVRVGYVPDGASRVKYHEVMAGTLRHKELRGVPITVFTGQADGTLHVLLGQPASTVPVIADWTNYYGDHIDATRTTLAEWLAKPGG